MSKKVEIGIIIATLFLFGILLGRGGQTPVATIPASEIEPTKSENIESVETTNWLTYRNEKYGFEFKYPPDWKFIESKNRPGFAFSETFSFIPSTTQNQYCDLKRPAQFLPEQSEHYRRMEVCNVEIYIEENSGQTIKDFLEINYLPYDIRNQRLPGQMLADAIDRLSTETKDGVEFARVDSGFDKFYSGIEGGELWVDLADEKRQYIINTGQYVIFITDRIHPAVKNKLAPGDLFDQIVSTVKILKKEG